MSRLLRQFSAVSVLLLATAGCADVGQANSVDDSVAASPAAEPDAEDPGEEADAAIDIAGQQVPADGDPEQAAMELVELARLEQPIAMAIRPGDDQRVYIAEREGRVRAVTLDGSVEDPLIDIGGQTSTESERGLLGLAWSPDGSQLFLSSTDSGGATVVQVFDVGDGGEAVEPGREVLRVDQPASNHNGGNMVFGPDGYLWLGLGDGGAADDQFGNGQRPDTLLGAMLRIDPITSSPYAIPDSNPFDGADGAAEVYGYGLRNPWRFSFDRQTQELWIADVGQNSVEEINRVSAADAGLNYGWPRFEGDRAFDGQSADGPVVEPVHTYDHARGCSITGGYVYRGTAIPALRGSYVYSDFCNGTVFALDTDAEGGVEQDVDTGLSADAIASFGEDAAGELYVLSLEGPVFRISPR